MLGHDTPQGYGDVFMLLPKPVSNLRKLLDMFAQYASSYTDIDLLVYASCLEETKFTPESLLKFLYLFAGMEIEIVRSKDSNNYTFLPEIEKEFGQPFSDWLIINYNNRTIKLPPPDKLEVLLRDIDLYLLLSQSETLEKGKAAFSKAAKYYQITPIEARSSIRRVKSFLENKDV